MWGDAVPMKVDDLALLEAIRTQDKCTLSILPQDSPRVIRSEDPLGGQPIPF